MPSGLKRAIRLPHAVAMVVGTIIGASIFVQPAEITGRVPSVAGVFAVWAVSGILTLLGALACAELASVFTRTGGVYVYLSEIYSPALGFLWGWAMFWSMHSGIIAALAMIVARYLAYIVPLGDMGIRAAAVAAIVVLSAVNYAGVKLGSRVQALFTLGKLVAIALIIVAGFILGAGLPEHFAAGAAEMAGASPREFLLALVAGLFAYGGWHMVTYSSGESVDPERNIPKALVAGTLIVTVCYMALNAVYMFILPLDVVASSTRIAADAADAVLGFGGGAFMSMLVVFSTLGSLSGIILTGPRVYYSMACDGLLFRRAGRIHPRFQTPHIAIVMQALWASILVCTGTYRGLFTRVVYTEWIFFGLMASGIFIVRKRGVAGAYRAWGYPVLPAVFVLASFGIAANQILSEPRESLLGLALVAAGLPVYYLWKGRQGHADNRSS